MKRILGLILSVLIAGNAWAGTCEEQLGNLFTAFQRVQLCKSFGSAVTVSLIPSADNTIDLGSATKTWRTLYTGTSRIAKTSDILRVRQDAQRLFTWDGSSDTALTMTFGDGGTTAVQQLLISASTADADDDSTLQLSGGGVGADATRGSYLTLAGADVGGANVGDATLGSTDDVIIKTGTSGLASLYVLDDGNVVVDKVADVRFSTSGGTIAIQEATAGSACSGTLTANGATPVVTSTTCATTGSRIFITRTSAETTALNAYISAISNGVSFSLTSEAGDTGTYNWFIIHEAP